MTREQFEQWERQDRERFERWRRFYAAGGVDDFGARLLALFEEWRESDVEERRQGESEASRLHSMQGQPRVRR